MKTFYLLIVLGVASIRMYGQNKISFIVLDSANKTPLAQATILQAGTKKGKTTAADGKAEFIVSPAVTTRFTISLISYESRTVAVTPSVQDTTIEVQLTPAEAHLDEVIVSSSRTNSRLEDLPTRVEVLGEEEVTEENGIKPGNIASLLGDIAGIQIQQTSAATGNADMRIQGVPGKYTQLLRDGMPLFGGYAGSFSILQIPPLDLQQIELVKGASSTLYGGGAIAGMVNLISKKPVQGEPSRTLTLNRSTLKENNLNAFFSARGKRAGYTLFAGGTLQEQVDVNKDGFSDVPGVKSLFVHPRLFLYTSPSSTLILGYTANYEDRKGGDMFALSNLKIAQNKFYIQNKSFRNTVDINWEKKLVNNSFFTLKGSTSFFDRDVNTNVFGMKANQVSWYSEASYTKNSERYNLVAGVNWNGEAFYKKQPDSSLLNNYTNNTVGAFAQTDLKFTSKFTAQAGFRADYIRYYKQNKLLLLPRLSLMYKFDNHFTARLGGGLGYKVPTVFNTDIDERDYHYLLPITTANQVEQSSGINADINYKTKAGGWSVTVNQGFFITRINHPLIVNYPSSGVILFYENAGKPLQSSGTESYVQLQKDALELYFGYTYTNAIRQYELANKRLPLTAKHKAASVIAYEFSEKFRAGIEASYTGTQTLSNGRTTSPYLFMAAMLRYNIGKIAFVLNCENLLDYRQNKKEQVVFPPYNNPTFPEIWAPLDGRVVNLSMMIKW